MVIQYRQQSIPVDPLQDCTGLSLFLKIFGALPEHSKPYDQELDLQAIHSHLKSMASGNVNGLKEQAKNILDGRSKLLNSGIFVHQKLTTKNEAISAKADENPQECPPGLGSLKPDSSQPTVNLLPSLDDSKLKDPKEFFEAHDRHENSRQDIEKQMGGDVSDSDPADAYRYARPRERRPDLGRKRACFSLKPDSIRPAVSTGPALDIGNLKDPREFFADHERRENDKQETQNQIAGYVCDFGPMKPRERRPDLGRKRARFSLKPDSGQHVVILEPALDMEKLKEPENLRDNGRHESSTAQPQNKNNEILDSLLSLNCEDLEGNEALNLLQEHLQIKPIELEKLCLTDFPDFPEIDLNSSREILLKPRRPLSNIHNLLKERRSKTPVKLIQGARCSASPLLSPTPPKSPFASLAWLNKRTLETNPSVDSPTPPKSPFVSLTLLNKRTLQTNPYMDPVSVDDNEQLAVHCVSLEHILDTIDVQEQPDSMNSPLIENDEDPEGANTKSSEVVIEDISHTSEKSTNDNMGKPGKPDICVAAQASEADITDNAEDASWVTVPPVQPDLNKVALDNLNFTESQSDKSSTRSHDNRVVSEHPSSLANSPKQRKQQRENGNSRRSRKQSNAKAGPPKEHKRKQVSRRQSLAGAGTIMKSGVRKSTRIRTRPLEYWKGERLLFGRVHQSLATVIGMKYVSPTKGNDGTSTLKVKSFVSDQYKELVELAALH